MKKMILLVMVLIMMFIMIGQIVSADVNIQQIGPTWRDSIYGITTTNAKVDSITFAIDSAKREAVIRITGEACLSKGAVGYISVSETSGSNMVVLGNDTLYKNTQLILDNPWSGFTSHDYYVPFEINLPIDHDSTGVDLKLYINAYKRDANTSFKLYHVSISGITNMYNDSI